MRGHVSSHVSSIALKDEENTVEKKYFAEGMSYGQPLGNALVHEVQSHTLVLLKNLIP